MRENHFTSDFQRVKMANSRDPRMAKVYDKKSIYYHCVSLKKLLSQEEQALMQPLEDSLRQQDKLRPPYGECHHCHDTGHWIGDCPEAKKLREQQMSTDKKKPAYGQCFICGLADHWAPNCPKREEDFTSQQSSISTEKQQSSVSTVKPSRKGKAPEPDISDISPKRRRLDTRSKKTAIRTKTGKKPYCFICKSDSHSPRSCTEMVAENWDKVISHDEPDSDSIVHIH